MLAASYPVVDDNDNLVYNITCSKAWLHKDSKKHRSIHVFIETFGGGFVLQKKSKKTENGGTWSSAISGHVHSYESYTKSALREAKEELGLDIDEEELIPQFKFRACEDTGNEFVTLFTYLLDLDKELMVPNSEEIDELMVTSRAWVEKDVQENPGKYSRAFRALFSAFSGGNKDVRICQ